MTKCSVCLSEIGSSEESEASGAVGGKHSFRKHSHWEDCQRNLRAEHLSRVSTIHRMRHGHDPVQEDWDRDNDPWDVS